MRLRFSLVAAFFLTGAISSPAQAQPAFPTAPPASASKDFTSYYTYYRSAQGETVSAVAARFGLAESSLLRMNPYLAQYASDLPVGTLVCVPDAGGAEKGGPVSSAAGKGKVAAQPSKSAPSVATTSKAPKSSGTPSTKKAPKKPAVETEWPSDDEWDRLADLATKGAPPPPERSSMVIEAPPSRLIRDNGEVVWIPAAKPRVAPKPKKVEDTSRGQLTSRKGKAIHTVIMSCRSYMGVPYVWGGEDPSGFDCSGYIQYVFGKHGIDLPRTADIQFNVGKVVKFGDEKPGDLVFFETYCPGPSHVGVYLGRDYFIHASSSRGVTVDRLSSDFFAQRYLGAKRNF